MRTLWILKSEVISTPTFFHWLVVTDLKIELMQFRTHRYTKLLQYFESHRCLINYDLPCLLNDIFANLIFLYSIAAKSHLVRAMLPIIIFRLYEMTAQLYLDAES